MSITVRLGTHNADNLTTELAEALRKAGLVRLVLAGAPRTGKPFRQPGLGWSRSAARARKRRRLGGPRRVVELDVMGPRSSSSLVHGPSGLQQARPQRAPPLGAGLLREDRVDRPRLAA